MLPLVEELGIGRPKELKEYSHSLLSFLNCLSFTYLDKIFKKKYKYELK